MNEIISIKRESTYRPRGFFWRASIGSRDIATGKTKEEAAAQAKDHLRRTLDAQMSSTRAGMCADGTILTAREYRTGEVEIQYHRADGGHVYRTGGSSAGKLEINGEPCRVDQYLRYNILMYDGMEYMEAAKIAMERETVMKDFGVES